MSILVIHVVPQGVLFAADRNVTTTVRTQIVHIGQAQRSKVLKWPTGNALIGYVGQASIGETMTDEWLLSFIGRHPVWPDFTTLGTALTGDLTAALEAGEVNSTVIVHMSAFERDEWGDWTPRIWFTHNTNGLNADGSYITGDHFIGREEMSQPEYHGGRRGTDIRAHVANRVFSYRQGFDLGSFNTFDEHLREAMRQIVHAHPAGPIPAPTTLSDWEKHARFAVLAYGAYFAAFYPPFQQYVGGGADVASISWPE